MYFVIQNLKTGIASRTGAVLILMLFMLAVIVGCVEESPPRVVGLPPMLSDSGRSGAEIREVTAKELGALIESSERPVLVEFSVRSGCYRCDDMRSPIRSKASEMLNHVDVVRVDFNLNRKLAREVGATVCPSYVVYSYGEVVSVRTWPISADFVAQDVAAVVARQRDRRPPATQ